MGEVAAVLIYDGQCPACRASALWLLRRAEAGGARDLEILPWRSVVRGQRFPSITEETCARAMPLVLPDGRVVTGAEAAREILRRIPRWCPLTALLDTPAARPLYAWIARTRMKLTCPRRSTPPGSGGGGCR